MATTIHKETVQMMIQTLENKMKFLDEQYTKKPSEYTLGRIGACEELRDELVIVLKFLK